MHAVADLTGRALAGRYELLAVLGEGGMGAVYRAYDRELDELVALKVIRAELASDPAMVERFRHEVKLARRVTHGNVARTFELGFADGIAFCTMELVDGEPLTARLARGALPVASAVAIAAELCDALAAAHSADVIHRDIKPDNILLARDGRVVLADFGVAAAALPGKGDGPAGTLAYMAPEQARGESPAAAADVYAVGVVLAEMLTGRHAFSGSTPQIALDKQQRERVEIPAELAGPEIAQVIARATERDVAARIASAAELRRLLEPHLVEHARRRVPETPRAARELRVVIVLPPREIARTDKLHVALGVHEQLLARLAAVPRLRVLPRVEPGGDPDATVVRLEAGDDLTVRIARPAGELVLHVPLAIEQLTAAAEVAASAVASVLREPDPAQPPSQALDMLLRARQLVQHEAMRASDVLALLEQASALAPDDPRIAAALAMAVVRRTFFTDAGDAPLVRARELVHAALVAGGNLAEAHIAAGHLELNVGDAAIAAGHFRTAIARAPHVAEAHEWLGRMLLEAGFLEVARARLDDALAIAPGLNSARWDIVRAHALEGRWDDCDRASAELVAAGYDRTIIRLRLAWWRGDRAAAEALRPALARGVRGFDPVLIDAVFAAMDGAWAQHRDAALARASVVQANRRRSSFITQMVAELAGASGDREACLAMLERAAQVGVFDLHWLERCPLLDAVRDTKPYEHARARIKRRAEAILDAMYGDHDTRALSDTVVG
ncbi:MAG TPA: protein kinase [Kofleriaceae bacterium]|nr:protein kinase [Kofleriaceae bacterium]